MPRQPSRRLLRDGRYTIAPEYSGAPAPRFVARFCGDWLGSAVSRTGALAIAEGHARVEQARRALAQAEADLGLAIARGRGD